METRNDQGNFRYTAARKRVKAIKKFYIHLAAFVFVNSFILILNTRHQGFMEVLRDGDNLRNLVLWGSVLVIHWAVVFGWVLLVGRGWEERKLEELIRKENQRGE